MRDVPGPARERRLFLRPRGVPALHRTDQHLPHLPRPRPAGLPSVPALKKRESMKGWGFFKIFTLS